MVDPLLQVLATSQKKREVIKQIQQSFSDKTVLSGGQIIYDLKKVGISEKDAEKIIKFLNADNILKRVDKITNIYDDLFELNKEELIKYLSEPELYGMQEESIDQTTPPSREKHAVKSDIGYVFNDVEIIPVFTVPPNIKFDIGKYNGIAMEEAFHVLIQCAKMDLKIISPFIDRHGLSNYLFDLVDAARKGVKIKLIIRHDAEYNNKKLELRILDDEFKRNDVESMLEIRNYHQKIGNGQLYSIHEKVIIADDNIGYVGSGEIRANSLWYLVEAGVIIKGQYIKPFVDFFNAVWEASDSLSRGN